MSHFFSQLYKDVATNRPLNSLLAIDGWQIYVLIQPVEARENVLEQDFTTEKINEKCVSDITYIHTLCDGWCYLTSVLDLHTKKITGYKFSLIRGCRMVFFCHNGTDTRLLHS